MSTLNILDPLWITKGSHGIDPEYSKYILLSANQKYRNKLKKGDISSFYEILFHSLNLNNLAVEGSVFNFNMTPIWDDPKLNDIRNHIRRLYQLPDNLVEIFKNANFLFIGLMLDYLDEMLIITDKTKSYYVNLGIHRQKEIFIVLNVKGSMDYDIWKLKSDKRYRLGHKTTHIKTITLDMLKGNALREAIKADGDPRLANIEADVNVIFTVSDTELVNNNLASAISSSLIFSKWITNGVKYESNILSELYELLSQDRILPFTMKSIV